MSESMTMSAPRAIPDSICCVIPAKNEARNLQWLLPELASMLKTLAPRYEIIVVDDGSSDDTAALAASLHQSCGVRVLRLSRNFGKEIAITAGLDHADSQVVVLLDADGQHPVASLPDMLGKWREGNDMVYGIRRDRAGEPWWKRWFTHFFYRLVNHRGTVPITPDAGDFRLFDRRIIEALRQLPERTRFMKGLYAWVGFRSVGIDFDVQDRLHGKTQFNRRRLVELALTGITAFTSAPLRFWGQLGALVSLGAMTYGMYIAIRTLIMGNDVPGWTTLTVAITFLGGVQLLSIGVLGEYIGRIFDEVKQRPLYLISERIGFDPP